VIAFAEQLVKVFPQGTHVDKIAKGAVLLRQLIGNLQNACDEAEKDPFDEEIIRTIEALRLKLKNATSTILRYAEQVGAEQDAALAITKSEDPVQKESEVAVESIDQLRKKLEGMFMNLENLKGEEFIKVAQEINVIVKLVTNVMQNKAKQLETPKERERMITQSKILNDSSIRSRILATVVAADKDSNCNGNFTTENGDSFREGVKVLMTDMKECQNLLEESILRANTDVRKERMRIMTEILKLKAHQKR
jgi:hypothetical protein